ncbi:hypothetical protein [Pectobacterium brasiliense]|uniref:hypothetical protein n=1 Tax=Pectobacterium brasiliense TaxID=180957 RepID=UPI001968EB00|nr:hypothetical protein [Pectobacterium brasiliense]MBN3263392.1 hypothetical protein [Pectobacterium brasiliense]
MSIEVATAVGLLAIPLSAALGFVAIIIGHAGFNSDKKKKISKSINNINLGEEAINEFSEYWSDYYFKLFGDGFLSKRQLITIPLFTILYSIILFFAWFMYVLIFLNPDKIIPEQIPMPIKLAIHDFYLYGVWYSILLDFISIQLTKMYIKSKGKSDFSFMKSVFYFLLSIFIVYFIFTVIIYQLKLDATDDLYNKSGLYLEPRPTLSYEPFEAIYESLNLIETSTFMVVTSKGILSNYFVPQAVMFYSSFISQISLLLIFISYLLSKSLIKFKILSIDFVKGIGTAKYTAYGFLGLTIVSILFVLMLVVSIYLIVSS